MLSFCQKIVFVFGGIIRSFGCLNSLTTLIPMVEGQQELSEPCARPVGPMDHSYGYGNKAGIVVSFQ